MAEESSKAQETGKNLDVLATEKNDSATIVKKKRKGVISRIWNGLFRQHSDDFEKRLQHISKEEATVLARMKKRSRSWRWMIRHLIIFSVIFEVIAVIYAIMTTRSLDLNWKMRAFRVLPMFLLPGLSSITYSALVTFTRMCDRKDQKTLEKLQAERKEKIDELKEKTNYYITQQLIQLTTIPKPLAKARSTVEEWVGLTTVGIYLEVIIGFGVWLEKLLRFTSFLWLVGFLSPLEALVSAFKTGADRALNLNEILSIPEMLRILIAKFLLQRYDPDPAAKAAAASVLASKLGTDYGLKVYVGDDSKLNAPTGKSNDVEIGQSTGLRHRNQPRTRSSGTGSPLLQHTDEQMLHNTGNEGSETSEQNQVVVEHYNPGSTTQDGGWIARIAALLVGEDPTQSYALICGNCHMHNGLARKEEFPYIVYYCPHCNALNRSKHLGVSGSNSPSMSPKMAKSSTPPDSGGVAVSEIIPASSSPVTAAVENTEGSGRHVSGDSDPISASSSPVTAAVENT
ncbi:hypothetical protein RHSIM_Rhsim04G0219000 [Rhododendron simsii]|uniref:Lunapark zinc ribbon domain-containing protein n=1 Tax=Rhododendron simsii TaxID=118357 RepID=A0A834LS60_RHOSS|nr:hypothetical protein RHSIM_Rhsim04G0219000 [Rhododendron simsii]